MGNTLARGHVEASRGAAVVHPCLLALVATTDQQLQLLFWWDPQAPAAAGQFPLQFTLQVPGRFSLQFPVLFPLQLPLWFPLQFPVRFLLQFPLQFTLQFPVHFPLWFPLHLPLQVPAGPQGWPCCPVTRHGVYLSLRRACGSG